MSKVSIGAAFLIAILAVGWFLLGLRSDDFEDAKVAEIDKNKVTFSKGKDASIFSVKWEEVLPRSYRDELSLTGRTRAKRRADVKVEQAGKVKSVGFDVWDEVKKGEVLVELEARDLPSRVRRAETNVRVKQSEYDGEKRLFEKEVSGEIKFLNAELALRTAEESLSSLRVVEDNLRVEAPFSGTMTRRSVEEGSVLGKSGVVGRLVRLDPMVVDVFVTDMERRQLEDVEEVEIDFGEGLMRSGKVEEVSTEVEEGTRTYKVSFSVGNGDGKLVEGMRASVGVKLGSRSGYRLQASWLVLDKNDLLGVMVVEGEGENARARFDEVELLSDDEEGVWVSGLEGVVNVVTLGNYYLTDGDRVEGDE